MTATDLDPVSMTLRRWAAEPFVWGLSDCALSVLHHAERVCGKRLEPAPVYSGELGAWRYARRRGGFLAVFSASVEAIGCVRVDTPLRGDIGMVEMPVMGLTAALCVNGFPRAQSWAMRGEREIAILPVTPVIVWRVPCPSC